MGVCKRDGNAWDADVMQDVDCRADVGD